MEKLNLKYQNDRKVGICDFIEQIKDSVLKNLSQNREYFSEYIYCKHVMLCNNISGSIEYCANDDGYYFQGAISFSKNKDFGVGGISVNDFVKELLEIANEDFFEEEYNYYNHPVYGRIIENHEALDHYYKNGVFLAYYDKECNINAFDKRFYVTSLEVSIFLDKNKILHKELFYKPLHDELMAVAWHPSRYLDWCIDFEELRDLKERWGEED